MTSTRRLLVSAWLFAGLTFTGRPARVHAQRTPVTRAALSVTTLAELRVWDSDINRMARRGDLFVRRLDQDRLIAGRAHERLDQYWSGVRVYGADVARQTADGVTVSLFGNLYPDIDIDVRPALTSRDAATIIAGDCGVALDGEALPQLLILPEADRFRLVYHAFAYSLAGSFEYFIDANNGAIVDRRDAEQRQAAVGSGAGVLGDPKKMSVTRNGGAYYADDPLRPPLLRTYDMKENLARTMQVLNGFASLTTADEATDADNTWADAAAVDAHAYVGYVYDYYYKRFGRHGLDNNDLQMRSLVHPARQADYLAQSATVRGTYYTNASWNPGPRIMLFGEGAPVVVSGQQWKYLAGGLDVVGHELTHGVTQFTSNLIYLNESGALNESFSDMMGTAVEFFYQPPGNGPLQADYLCGEDIVVPGGLRSLSNPAAYGDPDHYSRRLITVSDNGGVHTNSGIGNQAYYLAIEGGVNRTSGLSVTGVGQANREQIEKVMYRAFTQLMPSNATYATARAATIQAAIDLYGAGSAAERAITQAWTAVGVN